MRRATQRQAGQHGAKGTQGVFNFDTEAGATGEAETPAGKQPALRSAAMPQRKRAGSEPASPPQVRCPAKQRTGNVAVEKGPVRQQPSVAVLRGAQLTVTTLEMPGQVFPVDAPAADRSVKPRLRQDGRPKRVPAVDVQTLQPDQQFRPPTRAKRRGVNAVVEGDPSVQPIASAGVSTLPEVHAAPPALAPSHEASGALPAFDQVQPAPLTVVPAPATWRYQGPREEADRMYQRRFKTDKVPEPTMISGAWAYALPVLRP